MAALIDAFGTNASASTLRSSTSAATADARAGLRQLDSFIGEVVKKEAGWVPTDATFEVSDLLRGARGILSRQPGENKDPVLVGFARRLGARLSAARLPDDLRAPTRTEAYLRAVSAARPLSARIAEDEALKLGAPARGRGSQRLSA